jgi:hypothetical protein
MSKLVKGTLASHRHQYLYGMLDMLILSLTEAQTSEMSVSGDCSLTGIEHYIMNESSWYYHYKRV